MENKLLSASKYISCYLWPYLVHSTCPLHAHHSYDWLAILNCSGKNLQGICLYWVRLGWLSLPRLKKMQISNLLPLFHSSIWSRWDHAHTITHTFLLQATGNVSEKIVNLTKNWRGNQKSYNWIDTLQMWGKQVIVG